MSVSGIAGSPTALAPTPRQTTPPPSDPNGPADPNSAHEAQSVSGTQTGSNLNQSTPTDGSTDSNLPPSTRGQNVDVTA
jgi:hypothetical protein